MSESKTTLPEAIRPAMQNGIPCVIVSCSTDGVPNTTVISQIFYVDPGKVALSFQFFNKTIRNVRANPHVAASIADPTVPCFWRLQLDYSHSETEGPVFDEMDMQIEAIASATGMSGVFKLRAADIYRVRSWEQLAL